MTAEILSIGSELISGRIADTNAAFLADQLTRLGFNVTRHTTVGDRTADIRDALAAICARCEIAVVTGGIGPTPDDLTRSAFAELLGAQLLENAEAAELLRAFFAARNRTPSPSNLGQARIPCGAEVILNRLGTAAGFFARHNKCEFFCLPGVPAEMKRMFREDVEPRLRGRTGAVTLVRCLNVFGIPESVIGERLAGVMGEDKNPSVATQAEQGTITIRLTARGDAEGEVAELLAPLEAEIRAQLGNAVFGQDEETLATVVARNLEQCGLTLAIAESCTGGEVCSRLTSVPGISRYLIECAVTYSNSAKTRRLSVPAELIAEHGAVSSEVAEAMARGMRSSSGAGIAIALTGIAGPTGGTATKPVGLVYLALADANAVQSKLLHLAGTRLQIKERAAKHALNMLRLHLENVILQD